MSDPADDRRDELRRAQLAMRVGTEERQRAVAELREHFAAGRLTTDELEERTRDAFAARTVGDLARLLGDLPVADARLPVARERRRPRPFVPVAVAIVLLPLLVVLLLGLGAGVGARPVLVLFLAVVAVLGFRLVGRGF